jgi:hypothetical protein
LGVPKWKAKQIVPFGEMCGWLAYFEWEDTEKFRPEKYELAAVCQEIRQLGLIMLTAPGSTVKAAPPLSDFLQKYTNRFKPRPVEAAKPIDERETAVMRSQFRGWVGLKKGDGV